MTMVLGERLIEAEWGHLQLCGLEHVHKWLDLGTSSTTISIVDVVSYTNFELPPTYRRGYDYFVGCVLNTMSSD